MSELYNRTAREVVAQLKHGDLTSHDALASLAARVDAVDADINALPTRCFERAAEHADAAQKCAPLYGLPVAIKDLTAVAGVRTTFGSRVHEHHIPAQSDRLVARIEARGGVVYAKSNTPEFGAGGITFNDIFGATVTPHDTRCASGGSSGGAAAALASGAAWLAHGSDMAGSLRTPAAFCGVASLRPSPGKITADSEFLPYDILGADGPMARDIADLALFADAMFDVAEGLQDAAANPLQPARIAVSTDLAIADIDDEVAAEFTRFADRIAAQKCNLVARHPDLKSAHECFDILRAHAFAVNLESTLAAHPGALKPELVWNIEAGMKLTAADLRKATRAQGEIVNRAADFMRDFDLLICPATSVISAPAEARYPGESDGVAVAEYYRWLAVAYATTLTALPIITLPCRRQNGMPFAVQLVGKPGGERELFRHAAALERLTDWSCEPINPRSGDA